MKFRTKLWKRGKIGFATTVPHIVILNLNPEEKDFRVIWEFNEKVGKWTVKLE
ncbi:MAG: hypothetical protein KKI07_01030 [Euryarchaeota archaeon]|nr:hypothetical protein [Euryarchaeota archaeon]